MRTGLLLPKPGFTFQALPPHCQFNSIFQHGRTTQSPQSPLSGCLTPLSLCAPSGLCPDQPALHLVTVYKDIPPSGLQTPRGQGTRCLHLGTPHGSATVSCFWYMLHNCVKWKLALAFCALLVVFSFEAQNTSQEMDVFQRFSPLLKSEALSHTENQLPQAIMYYNW